MTKSELKKLISYIDSEASKKHIDLSEPENINTVWLVSEYRKGSIEYRWAGRAPSIGAAEMLAGRRHAIFRTAEAGRTQILVWKDGRWVDGYGGDEP